MFNSLHLTRYTNVIYPHLTVCGKQRDAVRATVDSSAVDCSDCLKHNANGTVEMDGKAINVASMIDEFDNGPQNGRGIVW